MAKRKKIAPKPTLNNPVISNGFHLKFFERWQDTITLDYRHINRYYLQQNRLADIEPLFKGMKLFKGKNIWLETVVVPGTMTCKNNESNKNKLIQLLNYYVRGKF